MEESNTTLASDGDLKLVDYVNARATEMETMAVTAHTVNGNNRAAQKVPRHMRRRAASYNIKRLPRTLRQKAIQQMQNAPPKQHKVPSRKHRRRPKNLLNEYNRRKRNKVWLETHIWHAKRFHMVERWGYKLALHANDKGARAAYRAGAHYCQVWDQSYLVCIELVAQQQCLLDRLSRMSSNVTGQTFSSLVTQGGSVAGTSMIYEADQYPMAFIGPVQFMWKPLSNSDIADSDGKPRTLWLWCHPSIQDQLQRELITLFGLKPTESSSNEVTENASQSAAEETVQNDIYKKYNKKQNISFKNDGVSMTILVESICRFKLRGPMSRTILGDALKIADISGKADTDKTHWWQHMDDESRDAHAQQKRMWAEMARTPSWDHLPSRLVFGLTVRDPRLFLPKKKCMVLGEDTPAENMDCEDDVQDRDYRRVDTAHFQWPDVCKSPLWSLDVRENVKDTMLTDQQLNKLRSENSVPGSTLQLGNKESRIPILVIHDKAECVPTSKHQTTCSYGDGWDLLVPAGWAMPFLIAMVYRGTRVGGLFELQKCDFEMGSRSHFPLHYPDANAGKEDVERTKTDAKAEYDRKPPAKRVNYEALGIVEPFHCPWKELMCHWCPPVVSGTADFAVLRDVAKLKCLDSYLQRNVTTLTWSGPRYFLVPVRLEMVLKGTCDSVSSICLPSDADLDQLERDPSYGGPIEPVHSNDGTHAHLNSNQGNNKTDKPDKKSLIEHCSRLTIGFVSEGGFSYRYGHGTGIGFIALPCLLTENTKTLLQRSHTGALIVLVRNPTTFQYRFARMRIDR